MSQKLIEDVAAGAIARIIMEEFRGVDMVERDAWRATERIIKLMKAVPEEVK